jgi:hypothetical protein
VEIVIIVKVDDSNPKIVIEQWEKIASNPSRLGTATRIPTARVATKMLAIPISRVSHTALVSGVLRLPFEKLFRQPADPMNSAEQDVICTTQGLELMAKRTWEAQELSGE